MVVCKIKLKPNNLKLFIFFISHPAYGYRNIVPFHPLQSIPVYHGPDKMPPEKYILWSFLFSLFIAWTVALDSIFLWLRFPSLPRGTSPKYLNICLLILMLSLVPVWYMRYYNALLESGKHFPIYLHLEWANVLFTFFFYDPCHSCPSRNWED